MGTVAYRSYLRESYSWLPVTCLVAMTVIAIGLVAPREVTMGDVQRIVYLHVAVAWFGLLGLLLAATTGLTCLLRRDLRWDDWAQASAEMGWICAGLTLVTGSVWAKAAWGTWWTWEPRLTSAFVLFAIYSGYLIIRNNIDAPQRRARVSAVVAIIGALDVPLVIMATRLFRGIHPVSPRMEPTMRLVLLLSVISFTLFFGWLLQKRKQQIRLARQITSLEEELDVHLYRTP